MNVQKFYTVKDVSDNLDISKPTVRKYLKRLSDADTSDNFVDDEKGTLFISQICFEALKRMVDKKGINHSEIIGKESENIENTRKQSENEAGNNQKQSEIFSDGMRKYIASIENQLEIYRKELETIENQLSEKDKQIDALTTALNNAQENNKSLTDALVAAQTLHAATIQTAALEDKSAVPERKGFFRKIFRK